MNSDNEKEKLSILNNKHSTILNLLHQRDKILTIFLIDIFLTLAGLAFQILAFF